MYILKITMYYNLKKSLVRNMDIHTHNTHNKCDFRGQKHRLEAFEKLLSETGPYSKQTS